MNPGEIKKTVRIVSAIEEGICYLALALLALLPLADIVLRLTIKTGFPDAASLFKHLLLALGLLSGMLTTKNEEHLSIGIVQNFSSPGVKKTVSVIGHIVSAYVTMIIAWGSLSFIRVGLMGWKICGIIPDRIFALVIPIGYTVMAFRFARLTPLEGKKKIIPYLALLLGTISALPIIGAAIWPYDRPEFLREITELYYDIAWYIKVPGVIFLLAAALAGTPLFVVMGGMALLLIQASGVEIHVVPGQVYQALTQDGIIPIPLFTLAGFILSESRAGERLVKAFRGLFGWFPGGMIAATVVICAFFTSFTGASGVTILALGGLLFAILSQHSRYPENFSIGLLTSTGSIGLLFPPSLPIILVGVTFTMTGVPINILHLFYGGVIPGVILVTAMIIFGIVVSLKMPGKTAPAEGSGGTFGIEPFNLRTALGGVRESIFELILPIFLVVFFFTGFLSIVELGAVSVVYVFIVEVIIHRDLALKDIPAVFRKAAPIIGGVLSIIGLSMALSFYIIDTQAPQNLVEWMKNTIQSPVIFLLLLNLLLLVVGCLMDIFSAILIVLPLITPLGVAYGLDPIHLGIIFITNLEVGFLTPPVGLNLFLASYRFGKPFARICRYVLPFLLIQFAVVLLVTYVPALSTFLPGLFR
ncbi:MAG: TRAP transporter large permease subunit [Treponema sp.]|nr:TRAP transporter large permease subunit [Treponema sp.]